MRKVTKEKAIRVAKQITSVQNNSNALQKMEFNDSEGKNYLSEEESFLAAGFGEIELEDENSNGADSKMNEKKTSAEEYIPTQRGDLKGHGNQKEKLTTKETES